MNTAQIIASVEGYEQNPSRQSAQLRLFLAEDQNGFLDAIGDGSIADSGTRGLRYALLLLRNSGILIPYLADPKRSSLNRASKLARTMYSIDSDFSNELLRTLEGGDYIMERPECRLRILDLILEIGEPVTDFRALARLSTSEDQAIRTKCVNIFARHRADSKTLATIYARSDARTRADMVEGLSVDNLQAASEVILKAARDDNNRVAANASVAAYRAGDSRALQWLEEMLVAEQPSLFRMSAVWAMGETKDPRFGEALRAASKSTDGKLRAASLRSLTKLDRVATWDPNPGLEVFAAFETPCCVDPSADVSRTICVAGKGEPFTASSPRAIDFFLYRGTAPILHYTVDPRSRRTHNPMRMACSGASLEELSAPLLDKLTSRDAPARLDRIAIYGPPSPGGAALLEKATGLKCIWVDSLRQAVGSLLDTSIDKTPFELFAIVDPASPVDLPLPALEEECTKASIGFYAVELYRGEGSTGLSSSFFPGEGSALIEKYWRGLEIGVEIQFSGPLSGVSLRIRQAADSRTTVSQTLEWR